MINYLDSFSDTGWIAHQAQSSPIDGEIATCPENWLSRHVVVLGVWLGGRISTQECVAKLPTWYVSFR